MAAKPTKNSKSLCKKRMTVLDLGCGPGFFTLDMAQMVGESGRVIAADLQEGMLQKLGNKICGTEFKDRIVLHKCQEDNIGIMEEVDFILAFYEYKKNNRNTPTYQGRRLVTETT